LLEALQKQGNWLHGTTPGPACVRGCMASSGTRKRRVVLYDDEDVVLRVLTTFFEMRGYEVLAYHEPSSCPLYAEAADRCENLAPCSDLIVTDYDMPRMSGLELLRLQAQRGCRLTAQNKAVVSGHISDAALGEVRALGCAFFAKPFRLGQLGAWVNDCEQRMDLSRPLGFPRKEERAACGTLVSYQEGARGGLHRAEVVNWSRSGLCIRSERPHALDEVVTLHAAPPVASKSAVVRWVRTAGADAYLVGLSCC